MIPSEIAALRALAEKATPGQWTVGASSHEIDVPDGEDGLFSVATAELPEDAAFIAAASPSVVIALLDALEAAESRAAALEAERDARPEITAEDAALWLDFDHEEHTEEDREYDGNERVCAALREHAKGGWQVSFRPVHCPHGRRIGMPCPHCFMVAPDTRDAEIASLRAALTDANMRAQNWQQKAERMAARNVNPKIAAKGARHLVGIDFNLRACECDHCEDIRFVFRELAKGGRR